jgi:ectoine hydroxylase-related dioxygenase (phytanoyl-CoA dioxygenase family)
VQLRDSIQSDGYVIIPDVLGPGEVSRLIDATHVGLMAKAEGVLHREGEVYGARDLIGRVPEVQLLARSPRVKEIIAAVLASGAFAVRGLFFDKTEAANWNLPWHQDVTVAVKDRRDVAGFGPWTLKVGIPHAHAPAELLARMVTIRIHLDACGPENGPMRVLRGSHEHGRLSPAEVNAWAARAPELGVDCLAPAGGAVLMRPLILHSSAAATAAGHRRVIHLEYASENLTGGLEWHQRV